MFQENSYFFFCFTQVPAKNIQDGVWQCMDTQPASLSGVKCIKLFYSIQYNLKFDKRLHNSKKKNVFLTMKIPKILIR